MVPARGGPCPCAARLRCQPPHKWRDSVATVSRGTYAARMAATCCVENCRYAVWGGATNCTVVEQQDNDISDKYGCWCDPGHVETDSLGNPSCVRKRSLIGLYAVVGAVAGLAVAFVLWKAKAHCLLPKAAQATRRARLRMRLIMATRWGSWRWRMFATWVTEKVVNLENGRYLYMHVPAI